MYAKFPEGAAKRTDPAAAAEVLYDAVIVGGGISGALIASRLSDAGKKVLILEAGPAEDLTLRGYEDYLDRFYSATSKDNQSPYPAIPNAPMPRGTDARRIFPGTSDASAYLVQSGPLAT
ncbi:NAD(P)-binding protein, partial [Streptomyces sp. NPDC001093]|uniref:NAD(P)-binding protein n=1 Tax=Streptomyces sp. NPDC001093 TaxID=3154376 RepID=UPI00332A92A6